MIETNEKVLKIVTVYFVPSTGINEIIQSGQNVSVDFHPGYAWEEIIFSSAIYSEPSSGTDHGTLYKQQLNLVVAGDEKLLQERMEGLKSAKPVIRFEYQNGTSKVIGDKENYCQVITDFNSEGFVTKRELNLSRQSVQPALFLNE